VWIVIAPVGRMFPTPVFCQIAQAICLEQVVSTACCQEMTPWNQCKQSVADEGWMCWANCSVGSGHGQAHWVDQNLGRQLPTSVAVSTRQQWSWHCMHTVLEGCLLFSDPCGPHWREDVSQWSFALVDRNVSCHKKINMGIQEVRKLRVIWSELRLFQNCVCRIGHVEETGMKHTSWPHKQSEAERRLQNSHSRVAGTGVSSDFAEWKKHCSICVDKKECGAGLSRWSTKRQLAEEKTMCNRKNLHKWKHNIQNSFLWNSTSLVRFLFLLQLPLTCLLIDFQRPFAL